MLLLRSEPPQTNGRERFYEVDPGAIPVVP
jgi:hypothetical protein